MKFFIPTCLSIVFSFVLVATPAIAQTYCVPCDELSLIEECEEKVDFFESEGCALDESCFGHCVAWAAVKLTKKCDKENGNQESGHPVCEKLKEKWVDQCQYDIDNVKCPKPCCEAS